MRGKMAARQQEGSWTPRSASDVPYSNQVPKPSVPLHWPHQLRVEGQNLNTDHHTQDQHIPHTGCHPCTEEDLKHRARPWMKAGGCPLPLHRLLPTPVPKPKLHMQMSISGALLSLDSNRCHRCPQTVRGTPEPYPVALH